MNKKQNKEYQREWRKKNKEKWKAIQKKSDEREERKEYKRKWLKTEKGKEIKKRFKENHPNYVKEYAKMWNKKNPEKAKAKSKKYYATIKGKANYLRKADKKKFGIVNEMITTELVKFLIDRDKNCIYCGVKLERKNTDVDHINPFKPLSKDNAVLACSKCNKEKTSSDVLQWMTYKGYKISKKLQELYKKAYF